MKLSKGKLSKIRQTIFQTRKKRMNEKKYIRGNKTFRDRKNKQGGRLHRRTLRGGVVTTQTDKDKKTTTDAAADMMGDAPIVNTNTPAPIEPVVNINSTSTEQPQTTEQVLSEDTDKVTMPSPDSDVDPVIEEPPSEVNKVDELTNDDVSGDNDNSDSSSTELPAEVDNATESSGEPVAEGAIDNEDDKNKSIEERKEEEEGKEEKQEEGKEEGKGEQQEEGKEEDAQAEDDGEEDEEDDDEEDEDKDEKDEDEEDDDEDEDSEEGDSESTRSPEIGNFTFSDFADHIARAVVREMGRGEYQEPIQANTAANDKLVNGAVSLTASSTNDDDSDKKKSKKNNKKKKGGSDGVQYDMEETDENNVDIPSSDINTSPENVDMSDSNSLNQQAGNASGSSKKHRMKTRKARNGMMQHKYFTRRVHER